MGKFLSEDIKLDFDDVLIVPREAEGAVVDSRKNISLTSTSLMVNSKKVLTGTPLFASNMDGVGTVSMAKELLKNGIFTCLEKHVEYEVIDRMIDECPSIYDYIFISIGISDFTDSGIDILDRLNVKYGSPNICLDVANGYSSKFCDLIKRVRDRFPESVIVAGNVVTPEMSQKIIKCGADIVKLGIGNGSVCLTRLKTGVGFPQLSAILECHDAVGSVGGHIVSDGGCRLPADVAKAIVGGASFVMLGSMLAGHKEGEQSIDEEGNVMFYGMSSHTAQEKYGGVKNYRASEGRVVSITYKGDIEHTINDILGGIRSTCTYVGASRIGELYENGRFIRVKNTHSKWFEGRK
jgi:GMP reductase